MSNENGNFGFDMNTVVEEKYSISLKSVETEFELEPVWVPENIDEYVVERADISRPGLPLAGYYKNFEETRLQLIGFMEHSYLENLSSEDRKKTLNTFFSHKMPAVIVTSGLEIFPEMKEMAEKHKVPLYGTEKFTSPLMAALIGSLSVSLAERITTHGVFVEVYGEGVLILGDSGIGKSETAIELIKRGHRLIADDSVEIKKTSARALVGSAPELIRHYIELRGIGVVDVRRLFGMGSIKLSEKIDMVVNLEAWEQGKLYERMGLDEEYTEILGIKIPSITIPVKPGRNLAVIIEIASMNNRQKKMGYNTPLELANKIAALYDK